METKLANTPWGQASNPGRPLVSVVVSTYNAEQLLPACLTNLLAQTIAKKIEIIVVDSGSEQNEKSVVAKFQERHPNLVYLRTERETLYGAWNRGLAIARGKYFCNANTDDSLYSYQWFQDDDAHQLQTDTNNFEDTTVLSQYFENIYN